MELLSLSTQSHGAVRTTEDAMAKQYEFWSTQPVPKISKLASLFLLTKVFLMFMLNLYR
jgi:hypothetical protein